MTVKEFNRIRHAAYMEAMQIDSVREAFSTNNHVWIFSVEEGQKHQIFALSWLTQMNNELLKTNGFTPGKADVICLMTLDRSAKVANFKGR